MWLWWVNQNVILADDRTCASDTVRWNCTTASTRFRQALQSPDGLKANGQLRQFLQSCSRSMKMRKHSLRCGVFWRTDLQAEFTKWSKCGLHCEFWFRMKHSRKIGAWWGFGTRAKSVAVKAKLNTTVMFDSSSQWQVASYCLYILECLRTCSSCNAVSPCHLQWMLLIWSWLQQTWAFVSIGWFNVVSLV